MSDYIELTTARKQLRAVMLAAWLGGGYIRIFDGTRPAASDDALTDQHALAVFSLDEPAGTSTDGIFTGYLPDAAMVLVNGVATWARCCDSLDDEICDVSVGVTGSGEAIQLDSTALIEGSLVSITAFSIAEG